MDASAPDDRLALAASKAYALLSQCNRIIIGHKQAKSTLGLLQTQLFAEAEVRMSKCVIYLTINHCVMTQYNFDRG